MGDNIRKSRTEITQDMIDKMVELYEQGLNYTEIAKHENILVDRNTVKNRLQKLGVAKSKKKRTEITQDMIDKMVELYQEGKNYNEIGGDLNISGKTVANKLQALGYMATVKQFTDEDIERMKILNDKGYSHEQIAKDMGRTKSSIVSKMSKLGIKLKSANFWTDEDVAELRRLNDEGKSQQEISDVTGRTIGGIAAKMSDLNIKSNNVGYWADKDIEQLKSLVDSKKSLQEIADIMNRTESSISHKMQRLGITSKYEQRRPTKWTDESVALAIKLFNEGYSYEEISNHKDINLSKESVRAKMLELGIIEEGSKRSNIKNYDYYYNVNDEVNGLRVIKQIRNKYNARAYLVQSLKYPDASIYEVNEEYLKKGGGCAYVSSRRVYEGNSLYSFDHIRNNIIDIEQAKKTAPYSNKKVLFKCESGCNYTTKMTPNRLLSQGFSCPNCNTNISYPERYAIGYLEAKQIPYDYQYKFDDSLRRIDFKIEIGDITYLLECNGIQHYEEVNSKIWKDAHKKTMESDEIKRKYAEDNNIVLIELDCRKSDFKFITNQINNNKYLPNITNKDIANILEHIRNNSKYNVKEIINDYNKGLSVAKVAKKYSVSDMVINGILERNGISKRSNSVYASKVVRQVETGHVFKSAKETVEKLEISQSGLYQHLNGKRKHAGKHPITNDFLHFKYVSESECYVLDQAQQRANEVNESISLDESDEMLKKLRKDRSPKQSKESKQLSLNL